MNQTARLVRHHIMYTFRLPLQVLSAGTSSTRPICIKLRLAMVVVSQPETVILPPVCAPLDDDYGTDDCGHE